jgi:hypothetical protein
MADPTVLVAAPADVEPPERLRRARRWATAVAVVLVLVALLLDAALQSRLDGFAATAGLAVLIVGVLVLGGVRSLPRLGALAGAAVFAAAVSLRTSPWLVGPDLAVALVLIALAVGPASVAAIGFGFVDAARRGLEVVAGVFRVPAFAIGLGSLVPRTGVRWRAWFRAVAVAAPILLVVGALLASADAVFASYFRVALPLDDVATHWWSLALGLLVPATVFVATVGSSEAVDRRRLGADLKVGSEAVVVLAGMVGLFALFVVAQVEVALRGGDYVASTTGLTYAEYARSGFFQLLWVVAIALVVVLVLAGRVDPERARLQRWFTVLAEATVVLTIGIAWIAIDRLSLYEEAFGLTMLRLACTVVAWWIVLVLVIVGVGLLTRDRGRAWLFAAVASSALLVLLACNVADPERIVVERNLARYRDGASLDLDYLTSLSDDAIPALVSQGISSGIAPAELAARLCPGDPPRPLAAANRSAAEARDSLAPLCATG